MKKNKKEKFQYKRDLSIYIILRTLVIITLIIQTIKGNFENAFLCILTLFLFMIPILIDHKLNIKLPTVLESIIFLFIFSAEILGEIQNFYGIFKNWDTILHTLNGFLCAAIGFSLIDILNNAEMFHAKMTPVFVALVAFCFSMTIGVLWEFTEYSIDTMLLKDMQKDRIVTRISSVTLNEENKNIPVVVNNIEKTVVYYKDKEGNLTELTIDGGYLDIGLKDTMKDLMVNFIGAVVYSTIGFLYIKNRDGYKFAEMFLPVKKTDQEIEQTKQEIERLKKQLEQKKNAQKRKKNNKK